MQKLKTICFLACSLMTNLLFVSCRTETTEKSFDSQTNTYTEKIEIVYNHKYSFAHIVGSEKCTTGEQKFKNIETMCAALQHDLFNNNCALDLRKKYFYENCSGDFNEVNKYSPVDVQIKYTTMKQSETDYQLFVSEIMDRNKTSYILPIKCGVSQKEGESPYVLQALKGTKLVIRRPNYGIELNKIDEIKKYKEFVCEVGDLNNTDDTFEVIELNTGDTITLSQSYNELTGLDYIFSCNADENEILQQEKKDFNLLVGSSIILNKMFSKSLERKVLLKCE